MLAESGSSIIFYAHYIETKQGKTGLTVTVDVWRIERDGTRTEIVAGANATEIGDGLYQYLLVAGSVTLPAEYIAVFKTATATVDQQDLPAMWVIDRRVLADADQIEGSDATDQIRDSVLSDATRIAGADLNTLSSHDPGSQLAAQSDIPSVFDIADQVWDEMLAGHLLAGSTGEALNNAGAYTDPWAINLPGAYAAGTAGWIIGTYLDSRISTIPTLVKAELLSVPIIRKLLRSANLTMKRGDTWEQYITNLGDLTGWTKIWFTARQNKRDADTTSAIQIVVSNPGEAADGLLYIQGTSPTSNANGSITVSDLTNGDIIVRLEALESAKMDAGESIFYDVQIEKTTDITTVRDGHLGVDADVTRATS